jgi:hypothetical protein
MSAKFLLGLLVFGLLNFQIGYAKVLASVPSTILCALVSAFVPLFLMLLLAVGVILWHLSELSMAVATVTLIVVLIIYIFYFRFAVVHTWMLLLVPVALACRVPFAIAVAFGLLGSPIYLLPTVCGTLVYYLLRYVHLSSSAYKGEEAQGYLDGMITFTNQLFQEKQMWVMMVAICLCFMMVYIIRMRSVDHAWKVAIVSGTLGGIFIVAAGNMIWNLHMSYLALVLGGIAAILTGFVLEFIFFSVNYAGTEYLQFEDDEYYYYVKAIPKIGVSAPDPSVKHINERSERRGRGINRGALYRSAFVRKEEREAGVMHPSDRKYTDQTIQRPEEKGQISSGTAPIDLAKRTDEILLTRSLTKELGLEHLESELKI